MKWSIPVGRVWGIRLGIHVTFFLIIAWIAWLGWHVAGASGSIWAVAMICLLFVCVVLHELGHSLVALRYGVEVRSITLLPIGGVAAMKSMPEEPRQELWIALAGPLVNVLILAVLIPIKGFPSWGNIPVIPQTLPELVDTMIRANMVLVVFNMLPAFPMDGGRVLRALLAMLFSYTTATAWASGIGRIVAVLFVMVGLYLNPFLALIGVFVFFGAEAEYRLVRIKDALKNVPVSALSRPAESLRDEDTLRSCLEAYHHHRRCTDFVVEDANGLCGILPVKVWMDALKRHGAGEPVGRHVIRRFVSFPPDIALDRIIQDMWGMKQELFPVMADGRVQGVLILDDVRNFIAYKTGPPTQASPSTTRPARFTIDVG